MPEPVRKNATQYKSFKKVFNFSKTKMSSTDEKYFIKMDLKNTPVLETDRLILRKFMPNPSDIIMLFV